MTINKYTFTKDAFADYVYWQTHDKNNLKKINELMKSITRDGVMSGIGKPEKLRGNLTGFYSRRITIEHRLVYRINDSSIEIISCRFHYE